jgi:hypothetical protein
VIFPDDPLSPPHADRTALKINKKRNDILMSGDDAKRRVGKGDEICSDTAFFLSVQRLCCLIGDDESDEYSRDRCNNLRK